MYLVMPQSVEFKFFTIKPIFNIPCSLEQHNFFNAFQQCYYSQLIRPKFGRIDVTISVQAREKIMVILEKRNQY